MNLSANLTKRITLGAGQRYFPAVVAPNGQIKPDYIWVDSKEVRRPDGSYIDYTNPLGKRVRVCWNHRREAQATRLRKEAELRAVAQGLYVVTKNHRDTERPSRPIALAITEFLEEVRLTKE